MQIIQSGSTSTRANHETIINLQHLVVALYRYVVLVFSSSRPLVLPFSYSFSFSISLVFYRLAWLLAVGVPLTGKVLPLPLVLLVLLSVLLL
jgi:hypothetical protein